jgi:hypothetical protein
MRAKIALAAAAAALVAAPIGATGASRAIAPVEDASDLTGTGNLFVLATVVIIAAAVALLPEDPASP